MTEQVNINTYKSQNFHMHTEEKPKANSSSQQLEPTHPPSTKPILTASEGFGKGLAAACAQKAEGASSLGLVSNAEESSQGLQRSGTLLLQSINFSANTPNKNTSIECVGSPKDRLESQDEYFSRVLAQEQKKLQQSQEGIATRYRKMQSQSYCNEDEGNLLPIASIVKVNNLKRVVECRSSESDNNSDHMTKISKSHQIATLLGQSFQSFQSECISEDDQTLAKCENCEALQQKTLSIKAENDQYVSKINHLIKKCSMLRNRPDSSINLELQEHDQPFESSANIQSFSQGLKSQLRSLQAALAEIKAPGFYEVLDFDAQDRKGIVELAKDLKYLLSILQEGKEEKGEETKLIAVLHEKYKARIECIRSGYEGKLQKQQQDFHKFMLSIENQFFQHAPERSCQLKSKVNSMSIQREEIKDDLMHLRQQLEHLEYTTQEEKKKARILERQNKLLAQKYAQDLARLKSEKHYYALLSKKYQTEFEQFMQKATSSPKFNTVYSQQFFREISERVFEISNCIPFQENDQQNLFAPESQEELFEMVERIRRFSLEVEEYYAEKDKEFCSIKKGVTTFVKRLLDAEKVSLKNVMETIRNSKDLQLDYLRDFLVCLKRKKAKFEEPLGQSKKKEGKRKSLTLEKVESLTFLSDQAHRNSQSQ